MRNKDGKNIKKNSRKQGIQNSAMKIIYLLYLCDNSILKMYIFKA